MTHIGESDVQRLFQAKQCLWPVLDPMKICQLAEKPTLSHEQLGHEIRRILIPVHYTCVPDCDLLCDPPNTRTMIRWAANPAIRRKSFEQKMCPRRISNKWMRLRQNISSSYETKSHPCPLAGGT